MKKRFKTIFLFLVLCLVISGCTSVDTTHKISDYKWIMESVSDLDGNSLENEMTVAFNDDNSFVLADKSNGKKWQGEYTTEKVGTDYKLDLYYEDTEEVVLGVYGTRVYHDKSTIPSVTFQVEDKILSFIADIVEK